MRKNKQHQNCLLYLIYKMTKKSTIFFILTLIVLQSSMAQIPLNSWRTHFSYRAIEGLEIVENQVYCFSKNGFFYVNITDNQPILFSKQDGISEIGISAMGYISSTKQLLLGYESGNIDLINTSNDGRPANVVQISDIKNAEQITDNKRINQIIVKGNDALLAADFGIIRFDIARSEIKETFQNIGKNGSKVAVNALAFTSDSVIALTSGGLLAARYSPTVNLQYFANWYLIPPPEKNNISQIITLNNRLFVSIENRLWSYENGKWTFLQTFNSTIQSLSIVNNQVVVGLENQMIFVGGNTISNNLLNTVKILKSSSDGSLWIATSQNGLVRYTKNEFIKIEPNGPQFENYTKLFAYPNQILAINPNLAGFDVFFTDKWQAISSSQNIISSTQTIDKKTFVSSSGSLFSFNIALEKLNGNFQNISAMASDKAGNIWLTASSNSFSSPSLYVRRANGSIQSFQLPFREFFGILIDDNDFKWLKIPDSEGGGIMVFDDKSNKIKILNTSQNAGNLPSSNINDFVKDKDGSIWVCTNRGIAVFDNPAAVFTSNAVNAYTPIFERRKLLANEFSTSIAIDGGNNKWIGTNNGLFHFSSDGTTLIEKFSEKDSPLPSNQIVDIGIEPTNGEVFVTTSKGMVSYQAAASEPASNLSKISIFPNPVRPEFTGSVAIRGLVDNAVVKITDLSGRLVFETRSLGGTASWNLIDYQGNRPQTGIYLVLVADQNGIASLAGKLAIVR